MKAYTCTCQLSKIIQKSRGPADTQSISYSLDRSPNLPDKINFWAFLCFSKEFSPKLTHSMVSGVFLCNILSMTKIIWSLQSKDWILMGSNNHVRVNILSYDLGSGSICVDMDAGRRESPDLGISVKVCY